MQMAPPIGWIVLVASLLCLAAGERKGRRRLDVSVYYESLCPDSQRFVQEQLLPAYLQMGDYLNVDLVPYGNALYWKEGESYAFSCQHGPDECYGNMAQTCYIHLVNSTESQLKFVNCAFNYRGSQQRKTVDMCIESIELQQRVKKCLQSPLSAVLEYKMGKRTDALQPRHTFIPWITLDGRGSLDLTERACEDFVSVVCEALKGDKPEVCSRKKKNLLMKFRNYYL